MGGNVLITNLNNLNREYTPAIAWTLEPIAVLLGYMARLCITELAIFCG
jgi:hypothetical protein